MKRKICTSKSKQYKRSRIDDVTELLHINSRRESVIQYLIPTCLTKYYNLTRLDQYRIVFPKFSFFLAPLLINANSRLTIKNELFGEQVVSNNFCDHKLTITGETSHYNLNYNISLDNYIPMWYYGKNTVIVEIFNNDKKWNTSIDISVCESNNQRILKEMGNKMMKNWLFKDVTIIEKK